jgi:hypothetical protein
MMILRLYLVVSFWAVALTILTDDISPLKQPTKKQHTYPTQHEADPTDLRANRKTRCFKAVQTKISDY